jgi:hypothetical protein
MRGFGCGVLVEILAALGLGLAVLGAPGVAAALNMTFPLDVEFDDGTTGVFGSVFVEEKGGKLEFTITLDSALGDDADLHEFYFNIADAFDDVELEISHFSCEGSYGSCKTDFDLDEDPSVRGGAGSDFDYGVNFGNGGSKNGNGHLTELTFKVTAFADGDEDDDDDHKGKAKHDDDDGDGVKVDLEIQDLLESSETSSGIEVFFAVHVQSTDLDGSKSDSETVGSAVPEPGTAALFGIGLLGIAIAGRRRS